MGSLHPFSCRGLEEHDILFESISIWPDQAGRALQIAASVLQAVEEADHAWSFRKRLTAASYAAKFWACKDLSGCWPPLDKLQFASL